MNMRDLTVKQIATQLGTKLGGPLGAALAAEAYSLGLSSVEFANLTAPV